MDPSLDKALLGMTLEEGEEPFVIPDLPEYYSTERNTVSLVGRLLNPQCQNISEVILEMPRKWRLYDRVRGVASKRLLFLEERWWKFCMIMRDFKKDVTLVKG